GGGAITDTCAMLQDITSEMNICCMIFYENACNILRINHRQASIELAWKLQQQQQSNSSNSDVLTLLGLQQTLQDVNTINTNKVFMDYLAGEDRTKYTLKYYSKMTVMLPVLMDIFHQIHTRLRDLEILLQSILEYNNNGGVSDSTSTLLLP